jgi:acyl-CoA reductase-like NAD-dependent aldehyde dehydrogenase
MTKDEVDKKIQEYDAARAAEQAAWRSRVLEERTELTDKLVKLVTALGGDIGMRVTNSNDFNLLYEQAATMLQYQRILTLRLRQNTCSVDH